MNKFNQIGALSILICVSGSVNAFWSFTNRYTVIGDVTGATLPASIVGVHQQINSDSLGAPASFMYPNASRNLYSFSPSAVSSLNATTEEMDAETVHLYDAREHFDSNSLKGSFELLQKHRRTLLSLLRRPVPTEATATASQFFLGMMLHQIQDFYSHSTYVEQMSLVGIFDFGARTKDPGAGLPASFATSDLTQNVCTESGDSLLDDGNSPLVTGYYNAKVPTPARQCNHGNVAYAAIDGCQKKIALITVPFRPDGINKDHPCFTSASDVKKHESAKEMARLETKAFVESIVGDLRDTQNGPGFCTLLGINPSLQICAPAKVDQTPQSFVKEAPITAFSPLTKIGWGAPAYTCTSSPATLPPGLFLKIVPPTPTDPGRCEVYGTPTVATPAKNYTFRVAEVGGLALDSGKTSVVSIEVKDTAGYWSLSYNISSCPNPTDLEFYYWIWNAPCAAYINYPGDFGGKVYFSDNSNLAVLEADGFFGGVRTVITQTLRSTDAVINFSSFREFEQTISTNPDGSPVTFSASGTSQYTFNVLSRTADQLSGSFVASIPGAYSANTNSGERFRTVTSNVSGAWTATLTPGAITTNMNGFDLCGSGSALQNVGYVQVPLAEQMTNPREVPSITSQPPYYTVGGCVFGQP